MELTKEKLHKEMTSQYKEYLQILDENHTDENLKEFKRLYAFYLTVICKK